MRCISFVLAFISLTQLTVAQDTTSIIAALTDDGNQTVPLQFAPPQPEPPAPTVRSTSAGAFTTRAWIDDQMTFELDQNRDFFSGIRILAEVDLGAIFQDSDSNALPGSFKLQNVKLGIETNAYQGWASLQFAISTPSEIQFDELSPIRVDSLSLKGEGRMNTRWGYAVGVSLFDGIIAFGYGKLMLDTREFKAGTPSGQMITSTDFTYLNVQLGSLVRFAAKSL